MAEVITVIVGPLEVNCYIVRDEKTGEAFVIDPGGDEREIERVLKAEGLKARYIVNTHGHFDHVGADGELKSRTGAELAIHPKDLNLLRDSHDHGAIYGYNTSKQPEPDILLEDGKTLSAGGLTLKVIETPGHTPGGVCLYFENEGLLFTGDTLFSGSIGRTDFPGGSYQDIIKSITGRLLTLGDNVKVLPGHGPTSTIGEEKETNPFVREWSGRD